MCFTVVLASDVHAPINASVVDYTLNYNGVEINSTFDYPLISYENSTYMAVRDVAELWNSFIYWDEENQTIDLESQCGDVDGYTVALAMGKAIVNKYYHEKITENTEYYMALLPFDSHHSQYWMLCVLFDNIYEKDDKEAIIDNADVFLRIETKTFAYFMAERKPIFKIIINDGPIK